MAKGDICRSSFGGLGIFGTPAHLADEMFAATSVRATHDSLDSRARSISRPANATRNEPRLIGGKLVMPAELQRIHAIVQDAVEVEIISDEMRAVVETLWPELAYKLPPRAA